MATHLVTILLIYSLVLEPSVVGTIEDKSEQLFSQ